MFQSVVAAYLAPEARAVYERSVRALVARHAGRAMWIELEAAPKGRPGPVELRVHDAGGARVIASCEWHPERLIMSGA
jgi:hypothetical protein